MFLTYVLLLSLLWPRVTLVALCGRNLHHLPKKSPELSSGSNVLSVYALNMVTDITELYSFVPTCPGTSSGNLLALQVFSCISSACRTHAEPSAPISHTSHKSHLPFWLPLLQPWDTQSAGVRLYSLTRGIMGAVTWRTVPRRGLPPAKSPLCPATQRA